MSVGVANNLRSLAAKIKFIGNSIPQNKDKNAGRLNQPYSIKRPPTSIDNRPTLNSISRNSEMSTENAKNVDENSCEEKDYISDDRLRNDYIRRTNDEAIRRGSVDDGLSGRIRDRLYNDRGSDRRQDEGLQLQATQGKSEYNQSGVSGKNEKTSDGINNSLKSSDGEPNSQDQAEFEYQLRADLEVSQEELSEYV